MDISIFGYHFMQNAVIAAFLGGIACGIIGVFVVLLHMPFIGVAMSHAAFAGALLGLWLGFDPLIGAFIFCLGAASVIGPLADRGELSPEMSLGVIFSLTLGLAFLFMGIIPNTRSAALDLLWGSILTIGRGDVVTLAVVAFLVVAVIFVFFKEIQATIFQRDIARAVGIPATVIFNPAAAAYQLTYSMKRMFILSACFGVLSGWIGLLVSYAFNIPSGATIILTSSFIFMLAVIFSPKRKLKTVAKTTAGGQ
jgi:manganese/iron transport system permease protein